MEVPTIFWVTYKCLTEAGCITFTIGHKITITLCIYDKKLVKMIDFFSFSSVRTTKHTNNKHGSAAAANLMSAFNELVKAKQPLNAKHATKKDPRTQEFSTESPAIKRV